MIGMMSLPLVPLLPLSSGAAATADAKDVDRAEPVMAEEEFRAFYERTARPLWAYLSRITGDPHAADDALQEAYYRFYKAGKAGTSHESESHRRNSLFRIATNVVRDAGRRAAVRRHVPLEEGAAKPDTPVVGTPVPERQAAGRATLNRTAARAYRGCRDRKNCADLGRFCDTGAASPTQRHWTAHDGLCQYVQRPGANCRWRRPGTFLSGSGR
jgi:DNA-directed RNA polymerase specialized sigma24 family protein